MRDHYPAEQIVKLTQDNWPAAYNPTHEFIVYLNRVRDLGFIQAREIVAEFSLSLGEFDILATLRRAVRPHVLTPTELQRSVLITSGGLTKLLYQLEASGLVSRSIQEQDKRSKLVQLTAKGKKTIERAMAAVMKTDSEWLENALTQREIEQLKKLLGKAAGALESRNASSGSPAKR